MNTILLVEDNPHILRINAEVLGLRGYEVLRASTAAEARGHLQWHPVDLIVLDIMLPDANGLDLCRELKKQYHVPILFLTALGENQDVWRAFAPGATIICPNPMTWRCSWPGWRPACGRETTTAAMSPTDACGWTRFL